MCRGNWPDQGDDRHQSREHALKYYYAVKKYVAEAGVTDVNALVAFSGDLAVDGQRPVTEANEWLW